MTTYDERLREFKRLVDNHDLTYSFSDDHRYWVRGQESWAAINEAAKGLDPTDCCNVWNEKVTRELIDGMAMYGMTVDQWRTRTDA